jgi:MFS family permease
MTSNAWRAAVAALAIVVMISGSTATSSLFVIYREHWGLTSADIAFVFSAYVGTLLPMLVFFGGLAERFGRRTVAGAGMLSMALGLLTLVFAHGLGMLIVARLLQGAGVGLAIGALTAAFADTYRGKLPQGNAMQSVTAVGLFAGPVVSAIAFNFGAGLNWSFVPGLLAVVVMLGLVRFLAERQTGGPALLVADAPFAPDVVARALRFAFPVAFISWTGLSLYLSLVPSYLAATLHVMNPLIGAAAVMAAQLASLAATLLLGKVSPVRSALGGSIVSVAGLALLVLGTTTNVWAFVVAATLMVGAGGGVASGAAFGIATRIGRGQRPRIFARMFVAAYLGYSVPALALGAIAVRTSFATGFITIIALLAIATAVLPFLREREQRAAGACSAAAAA